MVYDFSSVVLVFLLFAVSSYAIPVREVNATCKQTKNPSFCANLLNSKPGAAVYTLTQYTIDVARANITNTLNLINKLLAQSAGNPKAHAHYRSCMVHFGYVGALGEVEHMRFVMERGSLKAIPWSASAVQKNAVGCISGPPPFPDHSALPKYASVIEVVAQIIYILSKSL